MSLRPIQFGIKQLMILTTLSAVLLTVGRVILQNLPRWAPGTGELPLFVFLGVAVVLSCMPVMFSILLKRRIVVAMLATLALGALITYLQIPVLKQLSGGGRPDWLDVTFINSFALLQISLFAGTVRICGYGFASTKLDRNSSTTA